MRISEKSARLIAQWEGFDYPWIWPEGSSGVTIGVGYDLGYERSFAKDWQGLLSASDFKRLNAVVGIKGKAAESVAPKMKGIKILRDAAINVFENVSVPRAEGETLQVFPGADKLGPDAFGGLVSLVFNRGMLIDNTDRRREMLAIHKLFLSGKATRRNVAEQVASMARLWKDNPNSDGDLHDRRLAEAALIRGNE